MDQNPCRFAKRRLRITEFPETCPKSGLAASFRLYPIYLKLQEFFPTTLKGNQPDLPQFGARPLTGRESAAI
jgi:hypothetical protein